MTDRIFAENRFGLGPRGADIAASKDGRDWTEAQIAAFQPAISSLPSRAEVAAALDDYQQERRMARRDARDNAANAPAAMSGASVPASEMMVPAGMPRTKAARSPELRQAAQAQRDIYLQLVAARVDSALTTPTPFAERLAHFWANHFAVSAQKATNIGFAGLLEFEAIRPNLNRRFADMLLAVERHPAMLLYLDQARSIGPGSMLGSRAAANGRQVGLNENLAREILELHTLGVRTGYSQADVTEFARALTGWSVAGLGRGNGARFVAGNPGDFGFAEALHEPGARTILGKVYPASGEAQARAVLADLAVQPATARHIATKLTRHFAADDPPPAMVARLEQAFLRTGGDLPTVYRALLASPEAWDPATPKFRTPWDWTVASLRATGATAMDGRRATGLLAELGQPVWRPTSPAGWDDVAASWAAPDALVRRVEAAQRIATGMGEGIDARAVAPKVLGAQLTAATRDAIGRAESPTTGLALLLVSPEFLRR